MRTYTARLGYSKLALAALTAVCVMAAAVGTASANRLSTSSRTFRSVFTPLQFADSEGAFVIRCNVTLEGSFHSATISKVRGALIGHVTNAALTRPCTGGEQFILNGRERMPNGTTTTNTLPWHIVYNSFQGTLPNPTGIRVGIEGFAYLLQISVIGINVSCLYRSTVASPAFGIITLNASHVATSLRTDETTLIPVNSGQSGICPTQGRFSGAGTATTPAGGAITVTLI